MFTLFGAMDMLTEVGEDYTFANIAQLTLYRYHNEVKPDINQAIFRLEFDLWPDDCPLFAVDQALVQYRPDVYCYRPHHLYNGEKLLPSECCRVTRAEIETNRGIPKIEVVVQVSDKLFETPFWWSQLEVYNKMREYAPKWICEHYPVARIGKNKVKIVYVPVLVSNEKIDDISRTINVLAELAEASTLNFKGLRRNLF